MSANLRVLRAQDGEQTCLVMVKVGSASVCLPIDEARKAVTDAHDLPRQIKAAIALADQVARRLRRDDASAGASADDTALEPAGDADDGVISGWSGGPMAQQPMAQKAGKVSLPRRLCRAVRLAR